MRRTRRKFWWFLFLLPALALSGFVLWAETPPAPMPQAIAALQSSAQVAVQRSPWLVFRPQGVEPTTGMIFYPGGRIDPRSYSPAMNAIAAQGYLVVLPSMPLNLAVLSSGKASQIIAAFPHVRHWAIGGHSLGGAMAANYAHKYTDQVQGLVLWASYPASGDDLSSQDLQVASIYGTLDGLATTNKLESSRQLLPTTTVWVPIEGGNHAQFGWYGAQPGDNQPGISRERQQEAAINATLELLRQISANE